LPDEIRGPVALVGYMGSGKSTVGRMLARGLGWSLVDLDREIRRHEGRSIPQIFSESGEAHFREVEHQVLARALDAGSEAGGNVVACGGGAVIDPRNRELLRQAHTVFLHEDIEALYERTRGKGRPLAAGGFADFERRYQERLPFYREVAGLRIHVGNRPARKVSREIERWLHR
jgi:shikimate kinase